MPSWNDHIVDDDFDDEDDIEIVSLLDHQDGHNNNDEDRHDDDSHQTSAVNHPTSSNNGRLKKKKISPRVQLFGICAVIGLVLLASTILLSRSSSSTTTQELSDAKNPPVNANQDAIDGKDIGGSSVSEIDNEITNSQTPDGMNTTDTAAAAAGEENNEKESNEQLPSTTTNANDEYPPSPEMIEKNDEEESEDDATTIWFELSTGNLRIDRAYKLAMDELKQNIAYDDDDDDDEDGSPYFVTGASGERAWTRNTAYAIELGAGLVFPEVAKSSLEACTEVTTMAVGDRELMGTVWYQDTSEDFGGWPNVSDAIVGARGAWHLYLYTGDSTFLERAYEISLNSLLRAEIQDLGHANGSNFKHQLFGGAASALDSNAAYPKKYKNNGELVGKTKALSTNILYYSGYHYAWKMGTILMENNQIANSLKDRSKFLKNTIRDRLWMEDKGMYGYFEDENKKLVEQTDGLGIALAMLTEDFEATDHRINMMFDNLFRTRLGIPYLWPQFGNENDRNDMSGQHNFVRFWPLVSGYFAIAAARHGRSNVFAEEMASLIDLSEQENTFAAFYDLDKSFKEDRSRSRELWSDAAYLGMIYKGLFGMNFEKGAIEFSPNKVEGEDGILKMNETISLSNVKYRRSILDIYVTGSGTNVTSFKLNGEIQERPRMDGWVTGRQLIEIEVGPSQS